MNINQLNNKIKRIETEFNINKLLSKQKSVIDVFIYNLEMNDYEKEWKYKCKYCKEWLSNHHEGYVCPKCGVIYKEYSTKIEGYIGRYPISNTYLKEQR